MKKTLFSWIFISILLIPLFSFWNDCSVYDDLINTIEAQIGNLKIRAQRESNWHFTEEQIWQVLWTSKYASEYNSLTAEYNDAVRRKNECLAWWNSSSSSVSNSSYNNDNYHSNTSYKYQTCEEEFWSNSIEAWEWLCKCKAWYTRNKSETECIKFTKESWDENCRSMHWDHAIASWDNYEFCKCEKWWLLTANEHPERCVKDTKEQRDLNCAAIFWDNTYYNESIDECECNDWYTMNEDYSKCVKITDKQKELNCSAWNDWNASYSKESWECECNDWYIINVENDKCVKDTKEQREKNCKSYSSLSFLWDDWMTCECPEGYVADSDNDNYCLIALDQKSLSSRIISTVDAKCDDAVVIFSCSNYPTWDSCPAVCLEMYDAINWMYDNNLTIYNNPQQFWIYNKITREQASKFFVNFYATVFDKDLTMPIINPFTDIDNADPTLIDYIKYSFWLGLFKWTNWKFMPFSHLSKAQSLAVIIRMAFWVLDESVNPWYINYLYKAESLKLLNNINYNQTTLDNEDIMRWDVALMLYRLYENINNS